VTMTDESEDITRKIREAAGDDGALGGSTDSDGGAILTLDSEDSHASSSVNDSSRSASREGDSDSSDSEGESEGESGGEDS